jgi:hypothetical protein
MIQQLGKYYWKSEARDRRCEAITAYQKHQTADVKPLPHTKSIKPQT